MPSTCWLWKTSTSRRRRREVPVVTRDRDYGALVFVEGMGAGVIYLRVLPSTQDAVHAELGRALTLYSEEELQGTLIVVEPGRHRIRRITRKQDQNEGST